MVKHPQSLLTFNSLRALTQAHSLHGVRHAIPHATARAQKHLHQLDTTSVTPCFYVVRLAQQIQQ